MVQLEWDDAGRPVGSVQCGDGNPVSVYGWLGLLAELVLHMPEGGAGQT